MARGSMAHFLFHEGQLEDFGWEVHAAFWLGAVAVCLLINLLAARNLKKLKGRKRRRRRGRVSL
jgi:hypothetical protein